MKIESFEVKGYKNLTEPIRIDGLGDRGLVVVHGLNNVGKTNLLEAIQLPFLLIGSDEDRLPLRQPAMLDTVANKSRGVDFDDYFTLGAPSPITIRLRLSYEKSEAERRGVTPDYPCSNVDLGIRVSKGVSGPEWQLIEYRVGGVDLVSSIEGDDDESTKRYRFALYFARNLIWRRFVLVRLNRIMVGESPPRPRGVLPDELVLALWDIKESPDPELYRRWQAFVDACEAFSDVLGAATPVVSYDRHEQRASLYMQTPSSRIPCHLLGSGVQQLLGILARMLVSNADVVALEEPEASLSFALHQKLRDAMRRILDASLGPRQIFMTSHSPHFDTERDFIAVALEKGIPQVGWRSPGDAALFTGQTEAVREGSAPVSYVTSEGLVRLPLFVRDSLGVPQGGGVVFHQGAKEGHIEMVSNATALAELGWGGDDAEQS